VQKWENVLPHFRFLAEQAAINGNLSPASASVDAESYRRHAADWIVRRVVSRLNADVWENDTAKVLAAFENALTPDTITEAFDSTLARVEIRGLQARSLDAHIYNLMPGANVAAEWHVSSGSASLVPTKDGAVLQYRFDSANDKPIMLWTGFNYPGDPRKLHKLIFSLLPDDSWHQVDAELTIAGQRWKSQKTKYLGTTRKQSILFQLPSFDDTTDRKRIWVPMARDGPLAIPQSVHKGTLEITITPSSTAGAIWGKTVRNYSRVFDSLPFWRYVRNSVLLVALTTLGTLFSASFVAYAFARLHWPGRTVAFGILLATMMLPAQVTMIPSFIIWRTAGLYNTLCPLWLPAWFGSAFFIFLMVQHMRTIPRELEEAARIDGAGPMRIWAQIIMPETRPALAAIAIMVAMASWNDFMGPLIYLRDQSKFPLSLGLFALRLDAPEGGIDWTAIMAGNVLMTLPVLAIFFLFQRYFIQGMTMSGMKG